MTDRTGQVGGSVAGLGSINVNRIRAMLGTPVTSSDIALHANWGTSPAQSVSTNSRTTRGRTQITAGTTPGANPTLILTYPDGPYPTAPYGFCVLNGGSGGTARIFVSFSSTAMTVTYGGTPSAGTYSFEWEIIG